MSTISKKKVLVSGRVEPQVKKEVNHILSQLGLNEATLINIVWKKVLETNGIPFELVLTAPNAETKAAFQETEELLKDKNYTGKKWTGIQNFKDEIFSEED